MTAQPQTHIKKITRVIKKSEKLAQNPNFNSETKDSVALSWFDLKKPHLTGVSRAGVSFALKVKGVHLHEGDVLVAEDEYQIKVERDKDIVYRMDFNDVWDFAQIAYEVGNRHQPIRIENLQIQVLDDIALQDIIAAAYKNPKVNIEKIQDYFQPTGKAHHTH